ncbi:MAG: hypothetical protein DDT25_01142 [Chloroflexi bacterium]|nr:hypothetical protein [Chloroflexota bacterium]
MMAVEVRWKIEIGLKYRQVSLQFIIGHLHSVLIPLDLLVLDEVFEDVVPECLSH